MNIDSLKMFCAVVDEGSISKAARASFVSQPAVTRQIHQLEENYGALLFDRVDGKLLPTEAGKLLYPYAKVIIEYTKRSFEAVQELTGQQEAILNVGASLTIGEYLLPGLLGSFQKNFPQMKFSLSIGNTPSILTKLENYEVDIALVEGAVKNDSLENEKFAEDEIILVVSSQHRWSKQKSIDITELPEEKIIWREVESGTRWIVEEALERYGILDKMESKMELGSYQSIKNAVEAELGISLLPKLTVLKELKYGTLCEIKIVDFHLKRDLWMVRKNHRFQKTGLSHFIQFIRNE
ncbi:LysR family transcriptional regulator [Neobacillus niacini]|uniref:LysR family transcriptional regulator n=1 Tax=Neobacillus niacini TaxID=86668 RepID=UPI0021CB2F09|nr:LysR family transcriptional regulator [Neobacillus niacini]MCM3763903.1 LysR family transcriptional regulator [Neobacillus niacini]